MKEHNIELLVDLPGVGEHYMGLLILFRVLRHIHFGIDHDASMTHYLVSDDADTLDIIFRGDEEMIQRT